MLLSFVVCFIQISSQLSLIKSNFKVQLMSVGTQPLKSHKVCAHTSPRFTTLFLFGPVPDNPIPVNQESVELVDFKLNHQKGFPKFVLF